MAYKTKVWTASDKSKVVQSVRISLEDLQACKDLCEIARIPHVNSDASIIARSIRFLVENALFTRPDFPRHTPEEIVTLSNPQDKEFTCGL